MRVRKGRVAIVVIIGFALIAALFFFIQNIQKQNELNKVYATFTCNCCDGTLRASSEFCALGIKEKIKEIQDSGKSGQGLFNEAVKLLGIQNIADPQLRQDTYTALSANPNASRAKISLDEDYVNFGNVSESKTSFVIKDFTVKNVGKEDLYIYQVSTSCSCLTAKFVTDTEESPIYGRFSFPYGLTVKIAPGENMRLRVTYDARVNSYFRGFETRFVDITTNDVVAPTKRITIDVTHID